MKETIDERLNNELKRTKVWSDEEIKKLLRDEEVKK